MREPLYGSLSNVEGQILTVLTLIIAKGLHKSCQLDLFNSLISV